MATKVQLKTTFEADQVIRPIYTGGSVALDDGCRILATSLGEDAVLTDLATGKLFAKIEGDGEPISTLILTPSGSHLIVCSRSLAMRIYRLQTAEDGGVEATLLRTVKPHATPAVVLAVDRTSTLLATGAADGNIKVWDIRGGFVTHTFRGPSVLVSALHFFQVAESATSAATTTSTTKKSKKKAAARLSQAEAAAVAAGAGAVASTASTTGYRLAAGSQDGKVRVWDLHKRAVVANLDGHVADVQVVAYAAVHNVLLTAGRDKTMVWWDASTWTSRRVVPTFEMVEAGGFLESAHDEDTSSNKTQLAFTAGAAGGVRLWDMQTGREVTAEQAPRSDEEAIVAALYRPRQAMLLCIRLDQTLALYTLRPDETVAALQRLGSGGRLPAPQPIRRISGTHDDIIDVALLLPDQSLLALATNAEDVRIVSVADPAGASDASSYFGQDVGLLHGHTDMVIALDVDWSGHWIATGSKDNTARLWCVDSSGAAVCHAVLAGHAESVGAVGLPKTPPPADSPAARDPAAHPPAFCITGSQDLTVKRWDLSATAAAAAAAAVPGAPLARAAFTRKAHDKDINAVDLDRAGQLFASSSQDRTAKIWSARDGEVLGILRGHRRGVWSVRFAPPHLPAVRGEDGVAAGGGSRLRSRLVLTGSADKTVKLWNLADFACIRTFEGHTNSVLKVVWLGGVEAPDGPTDEDDDGGDIPTATSSSSAGPVLFASAGSDGLVKVWDASAGEAVCTLDNHEDRVWALAVRQPTATTTTRTLLSAGGDATITFWRDTTAATAAAAADAARARVEHEQDLANLVRRGAFQEAVALALRLDQPGRLLAVLTEATAPGAASAAEVRRVLAALDDDQLYTLLLRVRDWNTNARTAPVAQRVLATLLHAYSPDRLAALARPARAPAAADDERSALVVRRAPRNIQDLLDALLAYTERHYRRTADLLDESYLVDYTLREMDALLEQPAVHGEDVDMTDSN